MSFVGFWHFVMVGNGAVCGFKRLVMVTMGAYSGCSTTNLFLVSLLQWLEW